MSHYSQHQDPSVIGPNWLTIGFLSTAHLLALLALFMPSRAGITAFFLLYVVTALGITLGFHRYFTHHSFKAPRWVARVMACMGTLAVQGTILQWVVHHRLHHAGSDTVRDPHNAKRGFWFSHMGWMLLEVPEFDDELVIRRLGRDITADPFLAWLSKPSVMIGMQVALALVLWLFFGFSVMLWGVWARLVAVYHATWLVNSAAHIYGYRNYQVGDLATNNWLVAILALGEGWHNNHHAYADSAKHGHKWWELDFTWGVIRGMQALGLATDIRLATPLLPRSSRLSSQAPVPAGGI